MTQQLAACARVQESTHCHTGCWEPHCTKAAPCADSSILLGCRLGSYDTRPAPARPAAWPDPLQLPPAGASSPGCCSAAPAGRVRAAEVSSNAGKRQLAVWGTAQHSTAQHSSCGRVRRRGRSAGRLQHAPVEHASSLWLNLGGWARPASANLQSDRLARTARSASTLHGHDARDDNPPCS